MLVMLIFRNAIFLRSPESPDFDLLVLHDGENDPEVCERGLYVPYH